MTVPFESLVEQYLADEQDPNVRLRLTLLNLVCKLDSKILFEEICDLLKVPVATAHVWVRAWREDGYPGVVHPARNTEKPIGRPPALDDEKLEQLRLLLCERAHWTTEDVRQLIERTWDMQISASQVARILKAKIGMHFSKPYPRDFRRPKDAEEQLQKSLDEAY